MNLKDFNESKNDCDIYINLESSKCSSKKISSDDDNSSLVKAWGLKEPDLLTRMFYAQRSMEQQYEYLKDNDTLFKYWNDWIYKTLKIESLNDNGIEYPKWVNNNLSTRTADWIVCVGLVTSEIMGACLIPNSMSMLGFAPSNVMLIICFFLTLLSGGVIWWVFMLFDSPEYPVKTFADIAYIIGGEQFQQLIIFLQIISTILTCAVILITSAECLIILRTDRMCWVGLLVLLASVMMLFSLLKKLSVIGKYCLIISVINYVGLFVQLGFIGHLEPNWDNAESILGIVKGPIKTFSIVKGESLVYRVVAVANISYVFAGSIIFPEMISELKRPWEFWKSIIVANLIILIVYLIFGNYVYVNQGQFSNSPAVFGISNISAMKGLSFITFVTSFFQGLVFGHVSCKIIFKNYTPMIIKTIKFESKLGLLLWVVIVFLIWLVIFIIGAGVPQVSAVSAFTSSLTITPLTYIIPYLLHLAVLYQTENINYISEVIPFQNPVQKVGIMQLVKRGNKKYWPVSVFYITLCVASMSFLGMGLWASVEYMKYIFTVTDATSFSCTSPI